jgi:hypothetical protein
MRMTRPFLKLWTASVFLVAAAVFSSADTVTLKSGEKLDGKVLEETPTQYTIEYHVSASITDTRVVPKSDVVKIDKELPDEQPYQAIKSLKPGLNSVPAPSYETAVNRLQAFLTQFPQSPHAAEIRQNLADEQAEKKRVDGGEIKVNQRWYSPEEAQKERVQLNGQAIFNFMQDQVRRGDLTGAMNSYDQLVKTAPGSRSFPEAVDLAKKVLVSLKSAADQDLQNWKYQKGEREKGLQLAGPAERAEMLAAIDRQTKQEQADVEASNKAGLAWPPLFKDNEAVLTSVSGKAVDALKTVSEVPVAQMRQSLALTDAARTQMDHQNYAAAEASLKQATSLWSANELATRLAADVTADKAKAPIAAATPAANPAETAAAAATPAPVAGSSTHASQGSEAATTSDSDDKTNFFFTLPGIVLAILIIIFVLAGVTVYRKVVKRANEILE